MDADAIVIGAGAAGLAAARRLAGRSLSVVVIEARDRTGGRVRWDAATSAVPPELGAEFIHGPAEETRTLLREAKSATIDIGEEAWAAGAPGELEPAGDWGEAPGIFEGARALTEDESVARFLLRFDGEEAMRSTVAEARAFVEGFEAADPDRASARAIAEEWSSGVDSTTARPLGGYPPMFDHLRAACDAAGVRWRLSTTVRQIAWSRGTVSVETDGPDGEARTFRARAAVVTLPAGVMRRRGDPGEITFDPDLPAAKRAALQSIEMGHVVKVVLRFRTPFWERVADGRYRDASFFRCTGKPFAAFWTQVPVRSELIVAWAGGPKATAMSDTSANERIERALEGFGTMLGALPLARMEFEGGSTHDWSTDPLSRGAYSYVGVGGGGARERLAAPVDDTLFFAGEATSTDGQGGTVNGALQTGERAAREAASALGAVR
jgi:monoamine oxidase